MLLNPYTVCQCNPSCNNRGDSQCLSYFVVLLLSSYLIFCCSPFIFFILRGLISLPTTFPSPSLFNLVCPWGFTAPPLQGSLVSLHLFPLKLKWRSHPLPTSSLLQCIWSAALSTMKLSFIYRPPWLMLEYLEIQPPHYYRWQCYNYYNYNGPSMFPLYVFLYPCPLSFLFLTVPLSSPLGHYPLFLFFLFHLSLFPNLRKDGTGKNLGEQQTI